VEKSLVGHVAAFGRCHCVFQVQQLDVHVPLRLSCSVAQNFTILTVNVKTSSSSVLNRVILHRSILSTLVGLDGWALAPWLGLGNTTSSNEMNSIAAVDECLASTHFFKPIETCLFDNSLS
jgi:hypothetical protein